jgi:hypothetical protein
VILRFHRPHLTDAQKKIQRGARKTVCEFYAGARALARFNTHLQSHVEAAKMPRSEIQPHPRGKHFAVSNPLRLNSAHGKKPP